MNTDTNETVMVNIIMNLKTLFQPLFKNAMSTNVQQQIIQWPVSQKQMNSYQPNDFLNMSHQIILQKQIINHDINLVRIN